jgi:hypothetical protein
MKYLEYDSVKAEEINALIGGIAHNSQAADEKKNAPIPANRIYSGPEYLAGGSFDPDEPADFKELKSKLSYFMGVGGLLGVLTAGKGGTGGLGILKSESDPSANGTKANVVLGNPPRGILGDIRSLPGSDALIPILKLPRIYAAMRTGGDPKNENYQRNVFSMPIVSDGILKKFVLQFGVAKDVSITEGEVLVTFAESYEGTG